MKKLLALLLAVAMVLSLAACGSSSSDTDTSTDDTSTDTETTEETEESEESEDASDEDEYHVLTVAMDVEPTSLDPNATADGLGGMFVTFSVFSPLWVLTADGETTMILAESYEYNDDRTEFTITLRDDVTFADGNPITAEDVLYSYNNAAAGTGATRLASLDLENAVVVDDLTLTIPMVSDSVTLIEDLGLLVVMEKAWCEESEDNIGLNVMSSGAYEIESWETGMGIVLVKNESYFDADNVYYDEIQVDFISSEETRLLSFESGEYDIICLSESASVDEINGGAREDASVVTVGIQSVSGMVMSTWEDDYTTFLDVNVRLAIGYAIDVPTLVEAIMGSAYTVADSILPSANYAYLSCGNYDYDVDYAIELLAEAGYGEDNPLSFTFTVSESGMNSELAEAIQAMLAEVNIEMSIDTQDGATYMNNMIANTIEAGFSTYMGSYEPAGIVNSRRTGLPAHMSQYGDSELADLLEEVCTSTASEDERIEMWYELQELSYEYANFIPIYESNQNFAVADSVDIDSIASSVQADGYLFATNLKAAD